MRKRLVTLVLAAWLFQSVAAEEPYWKWSPDEAREQLETAREKLKTEPQSVAALNKLAQAIIISSYNQPNDEEREELLKALKQSYDLAPTQSTSVLLAQYERSANDRARWAVEALSYPAPSRHALDIFEQLVKSDPSLGKLENRNVQLARKHQKKWHSLLVSYDSLSNDMFKSYSQTRPDRRLPPNSSRNYKQKGVPTGPRLFVFGEKEIQILDPADGKTLHRWPTQVPTKLESGGAPVVWNASKDPDALLGADKNHVFFAVDHWFCVFRQKDAAGWARYFTYSIQAVPSPDGKVLIVKSHGNSVVAHRMIDGKELWSYSPGNLELVLKRVTDEQVVAYVPGLEQILVFDRDSGEVLRRLSYQERL